MTVTRYAPRTVYRVAYRDPISLPPWRYVGGGRFDDQQETYRVLYTSCSEAGACIERFQGFRPNHEVADAAQAFEFDGSITDAPPEVPSGVALPQDAALLDLTVDGTARHYAKVFNRDLTVADLAADHDYTLTQPISRDGFTDARVLAGIYSTSKIDPVETQNVTLYEGDAEKLADCPWYVDSVNEANPGGIASVTVTEVAPSSAVAPELDIPIPMRSQ